MQETFVSRIRDYAASQPRSIPFPPVAEKAVEKAEAQLGFSIPSLLKLVYLQVGNGGFGPGRGGSIIGLEGGYASDFGTLVETYEQLRADQALEGKQWRATLLPFCEWGCNIFSCVDCEGTHHLIYLVEEGDVQGKLISSCLHYRRLLDFVKWASLRFSRASPGTEHHGAEL
jgi:hypothetical protein